MGAGAANPANPGIVNAGGKIITKFLQIEGRIFPNPGVGRVLTSEIRPKNALEETILASRAV
jgi:hypothetical protein